MHIKFPFIYLILIAISVSFQATASIAACRGTLGTEYNLPINTRPINQSLFNNAILFYTNKYRCQRGIHQLTTTNQLMRSAVAHATGMAATLTYSHIIPRARSRDLSTRLHGNHAPFRRAGENIAKTFFYALNGRPFLTSGSCNFRYMANRQPVPLHSYASLANEVVQSWIDSPGHRANLLSRRFTRMGAGLGLDRNGQLCGEIYVSQEFTDNG